MEEFKSRTFRFGFPEGEALEAFKEDVFKVKEFDKSKIEGVISFIKKLIQANNKKERHDIYNQAVESNVVDNHSIIYSFFRFSKNFFDSFSDEEFEENETELVIEDIAKKFDLEISQLSTLKALLDGIKREIEWYKGEELTGAFEKGLFPNLKGVGTTVELRGVFNREIKYGEKSEDYLKDVEIKEDTPLIPVISIALTLDSGTPERFCFQISPNKAEWLIEELKAALIKAEKLREKYNI